MAKKKGGGKGKKAAKVDASGEIGPLKMDCFQLMAAQEAPQALPDEEYPEWVWKLAEPRKTITELELNFDNLNMEEVTQYIRFKRREQLRDKNAESLRF
eukprot:CAMPEP_0114513670 /NCGR_PEP_ID=MMETSP0109-20121206/15715_1 /TAXON_ID=29199 /ORGANISM="Chlorarachnion reptans, Strain CCCM449" /LENGTH=98 /DNA_ID=CAMNT_0001693601 /DNA_START=56 /DNA_END=352 /DNA_ORIENTATION=-